MAQATATKKSNAARSTSAKTRGQKAADVKGTQGHALATLVIAQARKAGEIEIQHNKSRKDLLKEVMGFRDNADHIAFRQDLDAALTEVKKEAEAAKISLNAYSEANPIAASIRAECSLWRKMSEAVEKGFTGSKVDMDKPWGEISKAATAHLSGLTNSTGTNAKTTNAGPKARKQAGRKAKTSVAKAKEFAASVLKDPVTKAPLPKDNRNLAQVVATIIADATLEELNEVAAMVQNAIRVAEQVKAEAEAKIKKASDDAKNTHDAAMATTAKGNKGRKGAAGTPSKADALIAEGKAVANMGPVGRAMMKRAKERA